MSLKIDTKARRSFIDWTIEAIEFLPLNDGAKTIIDKLLAYQRKYDNIDDLDAFLYWIEEACSFYQMTPDAIKLVTIFTEHRNQLKTDEEQVKAGLKNYWTREEIPSW